MKIQALLVTLLLISVTGSAQQDPCAFAGTVEDYINQTPERLAGAEDKTKAELASRANGDGLTRGRVDLLRRAFVAMDMGEVVEEEGRLVFNFNPDLLELDTLGQISPRVIVHEASLFEPLNEEIETFPEDVRQSRKDALTKELGDLDDVEVRLRLTPLFGMPDQQLQAVATEIFNPVYAEVMQPVARVVAENLAELTATLKAEKLSPNVADVCRSSKARSQYLEIVELVETKVTETLEAFRTKLDERFFFALADLIEGQPRLIGEVAFRRREGAAGPDEGTASLRFEIGTRSYRGWKSWAKKNSKALDAASVQEYLKGFQNTLPLFSLTADYTDISDFEIPLPGEAEPFRKDGGRKLTATLNGGIYLGTSRDHRLALEAKYDQVSGDGQPDRFVSTLSWIEQLNAGLAQITGGSELVVSVVYANKPEFRGEVDEDLGLRAGLKWSVGGVKD
jgi:hypothetical protein